MDREELTRRLMATFLEELEEHTETMNRSLLELEQQGAAADREVVATLFRTAHSLKGAARSVGVGAVEHVCHELEEILSLLRDGQLSLGGDGYKVLFASIDGIGAAGRRLRRGEPLQDTALRSVVAQLESVRDASRVASSAVSGAGGGVVALTAAGPAADAPSSPRAREAPVGPSAFGSEAPRDEAPPALPSSAPPAGLAEVSASRRALDGGTVRVAAEKLDGLLTQSGELLATRGRVESRVAWLESIRDAVALAHGELRMARRPARGAQGLPAGARLALDRATETMSGIERDVERFIASFSGDVRSLSLATARLDDEVRRARMVPFAEACEGLGRAVRDLCDAREKQAEVIIAGGALEIDRLIAQRLRDPILHLVRNAVDHGLESARERSQRGKPAKGAITVSAVIRGPFVEVAVEDDGGGVDVVSVGQRARQRGLAEPANERDVSRLIFMHGFSTARSLSEVSGRGVGLDAVKAAVESLHGSVELASRPGAGAKFLLRVPLTLSTLRVLVLRAGAQVFAVATGSVLRVQSVSREERVRVHGKTMIRSETGPIPLFSLGAALDLPDAAPEGERANVIVLRSGETAAFVVDELVAEHEVVVKSLGARLRRVKKVSGAAVLPNGKLALILNAAELVREADYAAQDERLTLGEAPRKRKLLVVDDTVTTRTLVKSILEGAGYDVTAAADGVEAFALLSSRPFDLVVSDVEMPRMDGLTLTRNIRSSEAFAEVPVILVTALASDAHRRSGLEAGANAYLVKTAFDQENLLQAIRELV